MKVAITGGTGFIGSHLARELLRRGHEVILISRGFYTRHNGLVDGAATVSVDIRNTAQLESALKGCAALVHCAGTSMSEASQSFEQLHVEGTRSSVTAARQAGVSKFVLVSYLNVRPNVRSPYHVTKWKGEQIVSDSGLNYTILKAGLVYGKGDHLLTNLSSLLRKLPIFGTVGLRERSVRLIAVEDLVTIICEAIFKDRLSNGTWAVLGPEEFPLSTAVRRIAKAMGKSYLFVIPFPVFLQRLLGWFSSRFMASPLITDAQVQMLADGINQPEPDSQLLPPDLTPGTFFTEDIIRAGLPTFN